jgi:hypothetical protein
LGYLDLSPHPCDGCFTLRTAALESDFGVGLLVHCPENLCLPALLHEESVEAVVLTVTAGFGSFQVVATQSTALGRRGLALRAFQRFSDCPPEGTCHSGRCGVQDLPVNGP